MAMHRGLGYDIISDAEIRMDAFLFGEAQGRIIVTISPDKEDDFLEFICESKIEFLLLGSVKGDSMLVDDVSYGKVTEAKTLYEQVIPDYMKS